MPHKKAFVAALLGLSLLPSLLHAPDVEAKRRPRKQAPVAQPAPVVEQAPVASMPTPAFAPGLDHRPLPDMSAVARQVERLASELVTQKHLPGLAIAIVQDGRILSIHGYGHTGGPGGQPIGTDTVFRLASLSKAFAATLTAQLVSEGAMDWDRPIVNQLPAFKLRDYASAQKVTVRNVLSHQVGLTHNTYDRDLEGNAPYPLLAEKLANAPLACSPGQCYGYQNVAFSLVGDLVFASTGDFYSHQVEKKIFHPLGMYSSTYGREALEASPSWARPHVRGRGGWVPVRPKDTYYHVPPAAGVNASIHDMAQWLVAQMGHRPDVLPEPLLRQIHTPQVNTPGEMRGSSWRRERLRHAWYALGFRVYDYAGHTLVFHGGAVQGYRGLIGFLPAEDVGLVVLWNSESSAPSGLLPSLMDRALGLPPRDWLGVDDAPEQD